MIHSFLHDSACICVQLICAHLRECFFLAGCRLCVVAQGSFSRRLAQIEPTQIFAEVH